MTLRNRTQPGECKCTGGPYEHGPEGREKLLAEIDRERREEPETEEGDE